MPQALRTKTVTVSITVYRTCGHSNFVPICIWCADAERREREIVQGVKDFAHSKNDPHSERYRQKVEAK